MSPCGLVGGMVAHGWHIVMAIFLPFASPYLNIGPITKAAVAVIQFSLWVSKVRNSWIFNFLRKAGTWIQRYHTLAVCFWGYFNKGTYCEQMTLGEIFSQCFNQQFGSTQLVFEGFKSTLNANNIIQWLVLLICLLSLLYLAFREKGRMTWITTLIIYPREEGCRHRAWHCPRDEGCCPTA